MIARKKLLTTGVVLLSVFLALSLLGYAAGIFTPPGQCRDDIGQLGPCPPEYTVGLQSGTFYKTNGTFYFTLDLWKTGGWSGARPVTLPITITGVTVSGIGYNWTGATWTATTTLASTNCAGNFAPLSNLGAQTIESCSVSGVTFTEVNANANYSTPEPYYNLEYLMSFSDGQTFSGSVISQ